MSEMHFRMHQERAALEADAQAQVDSLLAVLGGSNPLISSRGVSVTSYATLIFERKNLGTGMVVTTSEGERRFLNESAARDWHREQSRDESVRLEIEHREASEEVLAARSEWRTSVPIERNVDVRRDTGGFRKERLVVDVLNIDDVRVEVPAGTAEARLQAESEARYPLPEAQKPEAFESWWASQSRREVHVWDAAWILSSATEHLDLLIESWSVGGFPAQHALEQLERVTSAGWTLVHISEDHGVFVGRHARNGAALECVRYLFSRS